MATALSEKIVPARRRRDRERRPYPDNKAVRYLAGHAEPRTTGLYDRRQKKVTRNIVETISI